MGMVERNLKIGFRSAGDLRLQFIRLSPLALGLLFVQVG